MRIGAHTSISKSLEDAALEAHRLGGNTFQIFSASPRMWRASAPSKPAIALLDKARERLDLSPLVIHDNYLINLAALDEGIRTKSIVAFRGELERAIAIGAEYLVAHPGSFKGQSLEASLLTFVASLEEAARGIQSSKLWLLLENTAGQGAAIGRRFEEIGALQRLSAGKVEFEIGYCLDTCHCYAAGYNVATADGLSDCLGQAEAVLPLDRVKVIHTNDSRGKLGSHLDRHEHIGLGEIGEAGFTRILQHPLLRDKAFILETPEDDNGDHARNIAALKRLAG